MGVSRAAVVDAVRSFVLEEPEVDAHDVFHVYEVAALLAFFVAVVCAEKFRDARLFYLIVELIENGGHFAFVVLLRAVDVEIAEADDLAFRVRKQLTDVAVKHEF